MGKGMRLVLVVAFLVAAAIALTWTLGVLLVDRPAPSTDSEAMPTPLPSPSPVAAKQVDRRSTETPTMQVLVPTPVNQPTGLPPTPQNTITATRELAAMDVAELRSALTPAATATPPLEAGLASSSEMRRRLGVGVPLYVTEFEFDEILAERLGIGWYLNWGLGSDPIDSESLPFAQMVRPIHDNPAVQREEVIRALAANPGSLWLLGNEPDVLWQDNQTPESYAQFYHEYYTLIKTLDPTAQVAIGAISQVTPLRLQYLERVLAAYERAYDQPMPVDVWNIHTFVLREERDSWGVSIPPGFDVDQGMLWEIEDHDDLSLFRQQIVDFRRWMAAHDQRNKPLIVSEYGILMPEGYGFPPEDVARYMTETFDYLLNIQDPQLGYGADDNRLVQRLCWYSLSDTVYPTSNLLDPVTGELTIVGQAFADYAAGLASIP